MDTPEINLTKTVETLARELFIAMQSLTSSGRDDLTMLAAAELWDNDGIPDNHRHYVKRLVLASLSQEAVADIARQAYDACAEHIGPRDRPVNPWAQDWDDALKDL